jgi:AraC-like DNA-binding protein
MRGRAGLHTMMASQDQGHPFDGQMAVGQFGPVQLCRIASRRHAEGRAGCHVPRGEDPVYKLVFQLRGSVQLKQSERRTLLTAGKWSIYDVSRAYTMHHVDDLDQIAILMPGRREFGFAEQLMRSAGDAPFALSGMATVLLDTARATLDQAGAIAPASSVELGEMLSELAKLAVLEQVHGRPRVTMQETARDRVKAFVLRNLADEDLNLDRIAAALNCSKRYLHKVFSDASGTLTQFIWDTRLERCREDLIDPRLASTSITQIAFGWGFTNPAHFSRAFRNKYGKCARTYRQTGGRG